MLKYILTLIAISGVFTLDVYLPGIPDSSLSLSASIAQINFTFTLFAIVFACGQMVWGPLSDRLGRKPILLAGLLLASISTVMCAFAQHYWQLLCLRALQALGVSCFVVLNAIIRDLHDGSIATRWRAYLAAVSGMSISIAPSIGAIFVNMFGWRGTFLASSVVLFITLFMTRYFYAETCVSSIVSSRQVLKNYFLLIKEQKSYLVYAIQAALSYSIHFSFVILSAYLIIDTLGLGLSEYSLIMFIYGLSWLTSGVLTSFLSQYLVNNKIINTGALVTLLGAVLLLITSVYIRPINIYALMLPVLIMVIGAIIIRPTSITMALSTVPKLSGQAAAVINLFQFVIAGIVASIISIYSSAASLLIAAYAIICVVIILMLQIYMKLTQCEKRDI